MSETPNRWYLSFHGGEGTHERNNIHAYDLAGNHLGKALAHEGLPDGLELRELRGFAFGPDGDLYVEVRVEPDDRFIRDGLDILHEVAVPVTAAMTGTRISVPTIDGEEVVEIRAGTQPGAEIRLKGKGFPVVHGRERGDQVVVVEVRVPRIASDEGREALRPLAEHLEQHGDDGDDEGFFGRLRHAFR